MAATQSWESQEHAMPQIRGREAVNEERWACASVADVTRAVPAPAVRLQSGCEGLHATAVAVRLQSGRPGNLQLRLRATTATALQPHPKISDVYS